jgi:hypothetical protein
MKTGNEPSVLEGVAFALAVALFFSLGIVTEHYKAAKITGAVSGMEPVSGSMVKVTGMDSGITQSSAGDGTTENDIIGGIKKEYNKWIKKNKLKDTPRNRRLFSEHLPSGVSWDESLVKKALGIEEAEEVKEYGYEVISLPDGQIAVIDNGEEYIFTEKQFNDFKNFKKQHPTAHKTTFTDSGGKPIYIENGMYIDSSGQKFTGEATGKEKIGGKQYEVTYTFTGGTKHATTIKIGGNTVDISDSTLSQLKANVREGDQLTVKENYIVVNRQEQEGERTTYTTLSFKESKFKSETLVETKDKSGNIVESKKTITTYEYDKKRNQYVPTETTELTYDCTPECNYDNADFVAITTDSITGEPKYAEVRISGQVYKLDYSTGEVYKGENKVGWDGLSSGVKKKLSALKREHTKWKSRQLFATIESVLTDFSGLGYYATWFMSDEELDRWREAVDKFFAETYLGVEYWESAVCASKIERDQEGIAYVDTRNGLAGVAAHVEGSRSEPIRNGTAIEYLYKITFNVKNGDWKHDPAALEKLEFNVYVKGDRKAKLMKKNKKLDKGDSFGLTKGNAFVQYSKYFYDEVCIVFKEVPASWSLDGNELCNKIQGAPAEPTEMPLGEEEQEEEGDEFLQI